MKHFIKLLFLIFFSSFLSNCVYPIRELDDYDSLNPPINYLETLNGGNQISIGDIQGEGHVSPHLNNKIDGLTGIVTYVDGKDFYLQSLKPDDNALTSDAIYVHLRSPILVSINTGDIISVSGTIEEYIPGGKKSNNLSITQIVATQIEVISNKNKLPEPIIIGRAGFVPPNKIIDDDQFRYFDLSDGIDFYETLEGMLVQVNNAIVVGPTNFYGEIVVVGDNGSQSTGINSRGGITVNEDDFNPERIIIDFNNVPAPLVSVGDQFIDPIIGVLSYDFGNYRIYPIESITPVLRGLEKQQFSRNNEDDFTVATYNVENLSPLDEKARFEQLAQDIVFSLDLPDIIALQEIQDNNGFINDDIVSAELTYQIIIDEIEKISSIQYKFINIDPIDDMDGGLEGANIRVGFLYRTDREIIFENIKSNNPASIKRTQNSQLLEVIPNPTIIGTYDPSFINSRKPLIANFIVNNKNLLIINNHWVSKSGESPLFGSKQPVEVSDQRFQQSEVVKKFIQQVKELNPDSWIIVLGDLNDYYFSNPVKNLQIDTGMFNPIENLNMSERYNYIYEGNSQNLDNILVSQSLSQYMNNYQIIHINAEYPVSKKFSDHDPMIISFIFNE
ncbi:MAG TPA: endonuclease/exonuclease/phosphatase family protein [Anaerolineaceae bacterium]|nr:endonuclease/exonuclease/phosphatase family protein [Anaerolineaceae bacterium]